MTTHSQIRAEQRYGLSEFNPMKVMQEIMDDRCVQVSENFEKFSRIFYVRYNNRYMKVVTDYNEKKIKTVLPDASIPDDSVGAVLTMKLTTSDISFVNYMQNVVGIPKEYTVSCFMYREKTST